MAGEKVVEVALVVVTIALGATLLYVTETKPATERNVKIAYALIAVMMLAATAAALLIVKEYL